MDSCWEAVKNGTFASWARWLAVSNVLLEMAVPVISLIMLRPLPILTTCLLIIFSVLTGTVELPICCGCFQCCRWVQTKMAWFSNFLLRALLYAVVCTVLIVVQVLAENDAAGWYFGIANGVNVFLYLFARMKGNDLGDAKEEEGIARDKAKEKIKAQALKTMNSAAADPAVQEAAKKAAVDAAKDPENQRKVSEVARNNPDLASEALRAAAMAAAKV
mmetsp:Transcript_2234/g.5262  ORF Transcript_2234/g.5262 Transcript_2234/m.5262 type:complete len:218 (+) Transcript_2234:149-802(+)